MMLTFKAGSVCWSCDRFNRLFSIKIFTLQEELDLIGRDDEQKFLSSADYLVTNAMPSLISDMQNAVKEVLKGYVCKSVSRSLQY